jgi:TRAP-type C4-dicarboxylate transport system permease small subunit
MKTPLLHAWNQKIYTCEKYAAGAVACAMVAVMCVDVLHRVLSRVPGRSALLLYPLFKKWGFSGPLHTLDAWLSWGLGVGVMYMCIRAAWKPSWSLGLQRLSALSLACGVIFMLHTWVHRMPEGWVWAPYFALCGLLWMGMLGASMAMHAGQHLALEMGDKLWPVSMRGHVRMLNGVCVCLFCAGLAFLACISVYEHYLAWSHVQGADVIPALNIPKWCVFMVIPYAFASMAVRAGAVALGWLPQPEKSEVPS